MSSNLRIAQSANYMGDDWWRWSVWIEGSREDLEAVDSVTWHLHPTFSQPVVQSISRADKFRLERQGWGGFTIRAVLKGRRSPPLRLNHDLELVYPERAMRSASKDAYVSESVAGTKAHEPIVYICYSLADSDVVRSLSASLRKRGIKVELPEGAAVSGDSLELSVQRSIESSDAVVAVTSAASGDWVDLEASLASKMSKRVFNVVLDRIVALTFANDLVFHLDRGSNPADLAEAADEIADRIAGVLPPGGGVPRG